jgi:hypothetical protein
MDFGRKHLEGTEIFREKPNGHWAIWRFRVCWVDLKSRFGDDCSFGSLILEENIQIIS